MVGWTQFERLLVGHSLKGGCTQFESRFVDLKTTLSLHDGKDFDNNFVKFDRSRRDVVPRNGIVNVISFLLHVCLGGLKVNLFIKNLWIHSSMTFDGYPLL